MATSDAPLNVPNVTLAVARGATSTPGPGGLSASGAVAHGETLTLTGVDFGAAPTVYQFDDFSGGTTGAGIALTSGLKGWDFQQGGTPPVYDPDSRTGAHSVSAYGREAATSGNYLSKPLGVNFTARTELFFSYAVKVPDGFAPPPGSGAGERTWGGESSWKFTWLYSGSTGGGGNDVCVPTNPALGNLFLDGNDLHPTTVNEMGAGEWWRWNTWNQIEAWLKADPADPSGTAGIIDFTALTDAQYRYQLSKAIFATGTAPYQWETLRIPGWAKVDVDGLAPDGTQTKFLHDDIYIASSPQRVVIGNASTWDACTERTVCPHIAWSASEVQVTCKLTNTMSAGLYLFFVDSTNSVVDKVAL